MISLPNQVIAVHDQKQWTIRTLRRTVSHIHEVGGQYRGRITYKGVPRQVVLVANAYWREVQTTSGVSRVDRPKRRKG